MALPRLTIKLFAPKPGKRYLGAGNLVIPLSEVHAFAEWLLGQPGDYDDYLKENVVKLLAFEYSNRSSRGNTYRTVQLKDPADFQGGTSSTPPATAFTPPQPIAGWGQGQQAADNYDDEIPF